MHPGGYPDLILYPDGKLVGANERVVLSPNERSDKDRIYNESAVDDAKFDSWLEATPKPAWWKAGRYARERYIWMPVGFVLFYALLLLVSIGFNKIVLAIWHSMAI